MTIQARAIEKGVGLFGTKAGMTQIFTPDGLAIPATVIALEAGNIVTAVCTEQTRGYNAVQVGYRVCAARKITKPELGHLEKANVPPMKHLREFKVRSYRRTCPIFPYTGSHTPTPILQMQKPVHV